MFNLGIHVKTKNTGKANGSDLHEICNNLTKGLMAVSNLYTIRESIDKYGVTNQLRDLVGSSVESVNVTLSVEGVSGAIKRVIAWIKKQLRRLRNFVVRLFSRRKEDQKRLDTIYVSLGESLNSYGLGDKTLNVVMTNMVTTTEAFNELYMLGARAVAHRSILDVRLFDIRATLDSLSTFYANINNRFPISEQTIGANDVLKYLSDYLKLFSNNKLYSTNQLLPLIEALEKEADEADQTVPEIKEQCNKMTMVVESLKTYIKIMETLRGIRDNISTSIEQQLHTMVNEAAKQEG